MKQASRTFVIGDVHGCLRELEDLLREAGISAADQIICVGDLVGKGPDSLGVLRWAQTSPNVRCVLGNHEERLLRAWREKREPAEKSSDVETRRQLGARFNEGMEFISTWPLFIEDKDFAVVHGGVDPRNGGFAKQRPQDLVNIRNLPGTTTPWFESYTESRLVLFGHWAKPAPVLRKNVTGLDTGCVYGGRLTGMLLPERTLVSVPARRAYKFKEGFAPAEALSDEVR